MSTLSFRIRYLACLIWLGVGIGQGGLYGYASAVASILFLIALRLDDVGYTDHEYDDYDKTKIDGWKSKF